MTWHDTPRLVPWAAWIKLHADSLGNSLAMQHILGHFTLSLKWKSKKWKTRGRRGPCCRSPHVIMAFPSHRDYRTTSSLTSLHTSTPSVKCLHAGFYILALGLSLHFYTNRTPSRHFGGKKFRFKPPATAWGCSATSWKCFMFPWCDRSTLIGNHVQVKFMGYCCRSSKHQLPPLMWHDVCFLWHYHLFFFYYFLCCTLSKQNSLHRSVLIRGHFLCCSPWAFHLSFPKYKTALSARRA